MPELTRRNFLRTPAGAAVLSACGGRRDERPNVVVILTDDQRWDAMSCVENRFFPHLKTPNMDRIAAEGARFTNAFVTNSLCSPSRASFLSGLYAHKHGVINNFTDFPAAVPSYPAILKQQGYETAYIGKWHMGEQDDSPRPGYDYWVSHKGQGDFENPELNVNGERAVHEGYYTDIVTGMAVDWLKRPKGAPFCMVMGHKAAHNPFTPSPRHLHAFDDAPIEFPASKEDFKLGYPKWVENRIHYRHGIYGGLYGLETYEKFIRYYHASLLAVDESIGAILAALEEMRELDNTMVVFASDNGFFLGEHSFSDKRAMYEESIRIPLLVRYPKLIPQPQKIPQMVVNCDLAPTIVEAAGAPPMQNVHGRSWLPLLRGDPAGWRRSFHYEYFYEEQYPWTPHIQGVRTEEWKYIRYPDVEETDELYHIAADPMETRNLVNDPAHREKLDELKAELRRLRTATGAA